MFRVFQIIALWADKKHKLAILELLEQINRVANEKQISAYEVMNNINEKLNKVLEDLRCQHEIIKEELDKKVKLIEELTSPFDKTKNKPLIYASPVNETHFQLRIDNNPNGDKGLRCVHLFNPSDVTSKVKQELRLEGLLMSSNGKLLISTDQLDYVFSLIERIKNNSDVSMPSSNERNEFIDKQLKKYRAMKLNAMVEGLIYEMEEIKKHPEFIPWKLIPNGLINKNGEQKRNNGIDAVEFDENLKVKTIVQIKHYRGGYLRRDELQSFLNKCQQDRYKSIQKKIFIHQCKLSQSLKKEMEALDVEIIINEV